MSEVFYQTILEDEAGQRLDNYLFRKLKGVPKSRIYRIIRAGEVRINKKRAKPDYRLQVDDLVRIPPIRQASPQTPRPISTRGMPDLADFLIYEDNRLMVINKPAGLAVHGGSGIQLGLIEMVRHLRSDLHYIELVHRLDKETSGCLILAKKRSMLRLLQAEIRERRVQKHYQAILSGTWQDKKQIEVKEPLKKSVLSSGERMVFVDPEGKPSHTSFKLVENYQLACLVDAQIHTGRTHQIRVHSQFIGHPIIGDEKYRLKSLISEKLPKPRRLYLHASEISFTLEAKKYRFEAPVDVSFEQFISQLKIEDYDNE